MQLHHHPPVQTAGHWSSEIPHCCHEVTCEQASFGNTQCVITACVSSHSGSSEVRSCCLASFSLLPNFRWSKPRPAALPRRFPALPPSWAHQVPGAGWVCVFRIGWSLNVVWLLWQMSFGCCQFDFHRPDPSTPAWRSCEQGECSGGLGCERGKSARDKVKPILDTHRMFLLCLFLSF